MKTHPGLTISIYDIPGIVRVSLSKATVPTNGQAGFRCTGIWHLIGRCSKNVTCHCPWSLSILFHLPLWLLKQGHFLLCLLQQTHLPSLRIPRDHEPLRWVQNTFHQKPSRHITNSQKTMCRKRPSTATLTDTPVKEEDTKKEKTSASCARKASKNLAAALKSWAHKD